MSKLVKMTAIAVALAVAVSAGTASAKSSNDGTDAVKKYIITEITHALEKTNWNTDKKVQYVVKKVRGYCNSSRHNMTECKKLKRMVRGKINMLGASSSKLKSALMPYLQEAKAQTSQVKATIISQRQTGGAGGSSSTTIVGATGANGSGVGANGSTSGSAGASKNSSGTQITIGSGTGS